MVLQVESDRVVDANGVKHNGDGNGMFSRVVETAIERGAEIWWKQAIGKDLKVLNERLKDGFPHLHE